MLMLKSWASCRSWAVSPLVSPCVSPLGTGPGPASGAGALGLGAREIKAYHSVNFDDTVRVTDRTNFQLRENRAMNVYHGSSSSTRPSPFLVVWDDTLYIAVLFYNFSTTTTP